MPDDSQKDILHGVNLETILTRLLAKHGWEGLYGRIKINCFAKNPSIKSSLVVLRRTPWARAQVEALYIAMVRRKPKQTASRVSENDL